MATVADDPRTALLDRLRDDLSRANRMAARLDRINTRLLTGSLTASALSTVIAGLTAARGPLVGAGPPAWRWTCGVAAAISAVAGLLTGTHQRFTIAERLARARACTGQLRALEAGLGMGARDAGEGARQYEEIVRQHPELYA
jgi:hypothetical protein